MHAKVAVAVLTAVFSAGCIRSATLITVKSDGSGTVEQTMLMNAAALKGMLGGFGAPEQNTSAGPTDADFKRTATRMGEGVTYVSSEPVKMPDGFEGAKAIYAFTDITKLRIDQDPQMSGSSTGGFSTTSKGSDPVTFGFVKTATGSTLTVTVNEKPKADTDKPSSPAGGPSMDNPQMTEMMKTMFKGFKVSIDVEVAGKILETNADHVSGSRVTLLEMDLEALLSDEEKLKEVQKVLGPGASIAELKPYMKDVKGLKINDPVVTIAFR
jgi:hypothetical protein